MSEETKDYTGYVPELLDVGDVFEFETEAGVRGEGVVLSVSTEEYLQKYPYYVRWDDEYGKHYERFGIECFRSLKRLGTIHA